MVFEKKKHNTVHAIQVKVTIIYDNIFKNKFSGILALDFKKAFDTVNHEILLKKFEHYGIRGNCNNLMRNYLSNRTQRVFYNNKLSSYNRLSNDSFSFRVALFTIRRSILSSNPYYRQ